MLDLKLWFASGLEVYGLVELVDGGLLGAARGLGSDMIVNECGGVCDL